MLTRVSKIERNPAQSQRVTIQRNKNERPLHLLNDEALTRGFHDGFGQLFETVDFKNSLTQLTKAVVEAARESLIIGQI